MVIRNTRGSRCYFLVPDKKVPKEAGIGEALTAKPIGTSSMESHHLPRLRAALPYVPHPAAIGSVFVIENVRDNLQQRNGCLMKFAERAKKRIPTGCCATLGMTEEWFFRVIANQSADWCGNP